MKAIAVGRLNFWIEKSISNVQHGQYMANNSFITRIENEICYEKNVIRVERSVASNRFPNIDETTYAPYDRGELARLGFDYNCGTSQAGRGRPGGGQVNLTMAQWDCLIKTYGLPLIIVTKPLAIPITLWNSYSACHNI